jgi:hypothetical protein
MHPVIWLIILGPPCLAFVLWQYIGVGARTGDILPWQKVRLGKYGFWIMLAITYTATLATALVEHKI